MYKLQAIERRRVLAWTRVEAVMLADDFKPTPGAVRSDKSIHRFIDSSSRRGRWSSSRLIGTPGADEQLKLRPLGTCCKRESEEIKRRWRDHQRRRGLYWLIHVGEISIVIATIQYYIVYWLEEIIIKKIKIIHNMIMWLKQFCAETLCRDTTSHVTTTPIKNQVRSNSHSI